MENDYRERQRKSYITMRMVYDFSMAIIILGMGLFLLLGDKLNVENISNLVLSFDPLIRYSFGGLCILYGGFRLYRGIKHEY